jgi:hypothetical protein
MIKSYIISSPSRVGSTFLSHLLNSTGKSVVSTHNPTYVAEHPESTSLILLTRRDLFRSIMSALISKRKKDDRPMPFEVDLTDSFEFRGQYRWHKWYIENVILLSAYAKIEYLFFEDFVNNPEFVFNKLNDIQRYPYTLPVEEPLKYQEIVLNYKECKDMFDWYEQNPNDFASILWTSML